MQKGQGLTAKIYQALNVMMCEARTPRTYGTAHPLTYSDISLLQCVQNNQHAKANEISQYLGITNGAVAQLAKKLEAKGYLEPYRIAGNKKEVYYRLTESGEAACKGCADRYHSMERQLSGYIADISDEARQAIDGLFDHLILLSADGKNCLLAQKAAGLDGTLRRCEKCKTIY